MKNVVFPSQGFVQTTLDDASIARLVAEIDSLDKSRQPTMDHSHVGTIAQEYCIVGDGARDDIAQALMPCVELYCQENHFTLDQRPITLTDTWVNFQKPGEYLIPHTHKGIFSFALWIRVPFTNADEHAWRTANGKSSLAVHAFSFHYTDALGRITPYELSVDRSWERTLVVFPGEMTHSVTPYYSTDEERIVVSGNVEYV